MRYRLHHMIVVTQGRGRGFGGGEQAHKFGFVSPRGVMNVITLRFSRASTFRFLE